MTVRACAIIPSHNHHRALPMIVARLRQMDLPVLIVDDGSAEPARSAIAALADPAASVSVERLPENRGKGAAVTAGFRWALANDFTHALQVDADGQHDLDRVPDFLSCARRHPAALISGEAIYDDSVPRSRRIGRWVTHLWVFVETLSLRIRDSMCGFRLYPLPVVERLLAEETVGARMDFDTDIMVRLFWRGVAPIMLPVRVTYPPGNTSNFAVMADNWRISVMHTRLFFTMLARLPSILRNRPPRPGEAEKRWASLGERGTYWGLCFLAAGCRLLGRRGCVALMAPIVFYFYVTSAERRRASRRFLTRAFAVQGRAGPGWWDGYRHFLRFAERALDAFAAWTGAIPREALVADDLASLARLRERSAGALLVVSHVGNVELCRALLDPGLRSRLTVLVHTKHAENYNRVIREFQPESAARTLQVTDIGPEAAIQLGERIERGEWVAIAGDRVPVAAGGRVVRVPFLGLPAAFSQGPWLLAALLGCPVILLFCRQEGERWRLSLEDFAERVSLPRGAREAAIAEIAARYASRLEAHCLADPFQWGNFYDFWAQGDAA